MHHMIVLAAAISAVACDPGSFKRFPIEGSVATPPIEQVLREFEREHLGAEFVRAEISGDDAHSYLNCQCKVLRWYDREKMVTLNRGSFFFLAVFAEPEAGELGIVTGAFPSFGEPGDLQELRHTLTRLLRENGFFVNDTALR